MQVLFDPTEPGRVPIKVWARDLPDGARRQLEHIASQPWVRSHVAAMPDVHVSEGVSVGTVFATDDVIVPAVLGTDLGCGMSAQRFTLPASSLDRTDLARVLSSLAKAVPVGNSLHRGVGASLPDSLSAHALSTHALCRARDAIGRRHLGTLGGGNHFIELDRSPDDGLWVLLHSGSRGVGAAVAQHHLGVARALGTPSHGDLRGLSLTTPEGQNALADYAFANEFARANRAEILRRVSEVLADLTGAAPEGDVVDVKHNFADRETHDGREVIVHRKGATSARDGETGIIPGSMGTASYLVTGLGADASWSSCSHGAGRVMTRKEARAKVSPEALARAMRRVVFDARMLRDLVEEAPAAYRDIAEVIAAQRDLITPTLRLEPVAVLKG